MYFIDNYTKLELFWYQKLFLRIIYSKPLCNAVFRGRKLGLYPMNSHFYSV